MSTGPLQPFEDPGDPSSPTTFVYESTSRIALLGSLGLGICVFIGFIALINGAGVFALIFFGLAAGAALYVVPRVLANSRWQPAQLTVQRYPLMLGDEIPVRFEQRANGSRVPADQVGSTTFTLTCTEWVRYTVGTDTKTETHTVVEFQWTAPGDLTAGTFVCDTVLRIPLDSGAPSFTCNHNRAGWKLSIETPEPLPSFERTFDINVAAVIAPAVSDAGTIQDA